MSQSQRQQTEHPRITRFCLVGQNTAALVNPQAAAFGFFSKVTQQLSFLSVSLSHQTGWTRMSAIRGRLGASKVRCTVDLADR